MTSMTRRYVPAVLVCALLIASLSHASAQTPPDASGPVWSATAAQLALLGAPADANGYTLRPPTDFIPAPAIVDAMAAKIPQAMNAHVFAWRGALQTDGEYPILVVTASAIPTAATGDIPPDAVLSGFLTAFLRTRTRVTQSKIELGQIGGLPSARAYWKDVLTRATDQKTFHMRGFAYTFFDAKTRTAIIIYGEDSMPFYKSGPSAAMEASVLTLKPNN